MSWHYLQGQVEASWAESSLDGAPSALLSLLPTQEASCLPANGTEYLSHSQFGMMCAPLTGSRGEGMSMSSAEGSHARTLVQPEKAWELMENEAAYGDKWPASFAKWDRALCLWKTRQFSLQGDLESFSETWPAWGIMLDGECWEMETYQPTTRVGAFGLPRRPNAADGPKFYVVGKESAILRAANPERQLMLIHKIGLLAYGHLKKWWANPPFWEAAMGWPTKWTDLNPLETARFQQWLNSHGKH